MRGFRNWVGLISLWGVGVGILFGPLPAGAVPVVRVQSSLLTPAVGGFIYVFIDVSSVADLYAFEFDVRFDPAILSAEAAMEGPFLSSGGDTSFVPGVIDNSAGTIGLTVDSLFDIVPGVSGSGTLAVLRFQTLAGGVSPIDLSQVVLLDSSLADISFIVEGDSISAVPEGHTLMFFGSSLIILLGLRAKVGK